MRSTRTRRNHERKPSLRHENIDRQIWLLHKAMADKLIAHPHLRQQVVDKIEQRYQMGKLRHGPYLTWSSLMENIDDEALFRQTLLDNTPYMRKLRRKTPLVGVLTEQERQEVLMQFACGELKSVVP